MVIEDQITPVYAMNDSTDDLAFVETTVDNNFQRMTRSKTRSNRSSVDSDGLDSNGRKKVQRTRMSKKKNLERNKDVLPVDVIDLVDGNESPVNDINSTKKKVKIDDGLDITLDSDAEDKKFEPLVEVKALWNHTINKIERFSLKKSDPLLPIFEYFAKLNNVDKDKIRIVRNDYKPIHPYDSVDSQNLRVTNFLIASLISNEKESEDINACSNENIMSIKCQFKDRKKPLLCRLHRNQPIVFVAKQCAHELGCDIERIKLYFDGDLIKSNDTPTTLEFEGEECVDVVLS